MLEIGILVFIPYKAYMKTRHKGQNMKKIPSLYAVIILFVLLQNLQALSAIQNEMSLKNRWVDSHLKQQPQKDASPNDYNAIQVLYREGDWWDATRTNADCFGKPLRIGTETFANGLFFHSPHTLLVRLAKPAKSFTARIGIAESSNAGAAQIFEFLEPQPGEKAYYRNPAVSFDAEPLPVNFELNGQRQFIIRVHGETGDNHTALGDGKIIFTDGTEILLGDMEIIDLLPDAACDITPPFSFLYHGVPFQGLCEKWETERKNTRLDENRTLHQIDWTDPATGLKVSCRATDYDDFPTVEWVVYFENTAANDTAIISDIKALDFHIAPGAGRNYTLYHAYGSDMKMEDFGLRTDPITPDTEKTIGSAFMSSTQALPFFNVALGDKMGFITGIGWSGGWNSVFRMDKEGSFNIQAAIAEETHFKLLPGEKVRSPRILMMFWKNDRIQGHNLWRRLLLKHYSPRPDGQLLRAPLTDGNWGSLSADRHKAVIDWWTANQLPMEGYWIDAGWSGKTGPISDWPLNAATRIVNPEIYPDGMRALSDYARKAGMKFLLWFWPHRALTDMEIGKEHPEWIYGESLDMADDAVTDWMIEYYSKLISDYGIDIFRQDGHAVIRPDTAEDRKGIQVIKYFTNHYRFWDELLRRHPGLIIDNCCGGGRKIDLETTMRSISLWRSDLQVPNDFDVVAMQGQTAGISFWVPLSGGCSARTNVREQTDSYNFRSGYSPALTLNWHLFSDKAESPEFDMDQARKLLNEYLSIRDCFYGDYYPLTPYNVDKENWLGWQFNRPEAGDGMVQMFRRENSMYCGMNCPLQGLEPQAVYELKNFDQPDTVRISGKTLMKGLMIMMEKKPQAALYYYKKVE